MGRPLTIFLLFPWISWVACAPLVPEGGAARALVRDLERIVEARRQIGWELSQLRARVQPGLRVGGGLEFARTQLRGFIPAVTLSLEYDYFPAVGGLPAVHRLGGGLRGGLAMGL